MLNQVSKESVDLTQQNIEKLKELFPEILTDGNKVDFDMLQTILGEEIDGEKERYSFTWPGKRDAIIGAQQPSKGTLRPNKEKSKKFDTTENLYIEGDNLEVLKLLQKSYNSKIKMIYIDPPYNTGKDFVYKDNFRDGVNNYLKQTGQLDPEGNVYSTNSESNGRFHTDWLNMMYPRLKLAKNLLTKDGVIFISIDDYEQANLKKICDEIFGEKNFVGKISRATGTTTGQDAKQIGSSLDYCLIYSKTSEFVLKGLPLSEKDLKRFSEEDSKGKYSMLQLRKTGNADTKEDRPNMFYPVLAPDNTEVYPFGPSNYLSRWRVSKETYNELKKNDMIVWKKNEAKEKIVIEGITKSDWVPYVKYYAENRTKQVSNLFREIEGNKKASLSLKELFGVKDIFDNPKPLEFIKILELISMDKDDIVLDFFSGSSSTAHATMMLNAEDNGQRKYIMVQLPEFLEKSAKGYQLGYRTISDVGSERIRLAGDKILLEKPNLKGKIDIGFKYLVLNKSNIKEWNTDFDSLEDEIDLFAEVFVEGRNELDVVYEIMLKNGLELTLPVNFFEVDGKKVYDIAFGLQFVCLADGINTSIAKAIINKRDEYGIEIISGVVFKDAGFNGNDSEKLNCIQLLKDAGFIEENLQTI